MVREQKIAIIFVHGLGLTGEVWWPQLEWCRRHDLHAVAPTWRLNKDGCGAKSIASLTNDIVKISEGYSGVILVGHSFGGLICALAAKRLRNLHSSLLINPWLEFSQINPLAYFFLKLVNGLQRTFNFQLKSRFSHKNQAFWRFWIYPYALISNDASELLEIFNQISNQKSFTLEDDTTIIFSRSDELLKRPGQAGHIVPVDGHMLPCLAPGIINKYLKHIIKTLPIL